MKTLLILGGMMALLLVIGMAPASANCGTCTTCGTTASVETMTPPVACDIAEFTPQAKYMSLPGMIRWQHRQQTGTWITLAEARQLAGQRQQVCGLPADTFAH